MAISDGFRAGLSQPLAVPGAQLPVDMSEYAGHPDDILKQHDMLYEQLLKQQQRAEKLRAERQEEGYKMSEFIGSNPISRRRYLLTKLAEGTGDNSVTAPAPVPEVDGGNQTPPTSSYNDGGQLAYTEPSIPAPPNSPPKPPTYNQQTRAPAPPTGSRQQVPYEPPSFFGLSSASAEPPRYTQNSRRPAQRYASEDGLEELGSSGQVLNRLREFNQDMQGYLSRDPGGRSTQSNEPSGILDTLQHYGTRAVRLGAHGAQRLASKAYDSNFLGLRDSGYMDPRQMARINATLAHSSTGSDRAVYEDRYRNIDIDPNTEGVQGLDRDLLDQAIFREQLVTDELRGLSTTRELTPEEIENRRAGIEARIDSIYGFKGNRLNTPPINEDYDGTSFRRASSALGNILTNPAGASRAYNVASELVNSNSPIISELQTAYNQLPEGSRTDFTSFVANELTKLTGNMSSKPLQLAGQDTKDTEDDVFETREERFTRYNRARDQIESLVDGLQSNPDAQLQLLQSVAPDAANMANELGSLYAEDPEKAIAMINDMDPATAAIIRDQVELVRSFIPESAVTSIADDNLRKFERLEYNDSWLPNLFGEDTVNPAMQSVGGGSDTRNFSGDARNSTFFYNSMHDGPASDEWYLVDSGVLGNTYYNRVTGETNYELLRDFAGWLPGNTNPNRMLPRSEWGRYEQRFGTTPQYRDWD